MWKTAKYLVAMVLVIALFASTSGIALADDGQQGNGGQNSFWDVLARAFNTTAENAKNLFMQAGGRRPPPSGDNMTPSQPPPAENRGAVTQEQLDKMVADGRLTQEQADEYAAWLAAKPEGQYGDPNQMQQLLEDGTITQEQYDAWNAWNETKPDIELPRPDRQGNDGPGQPPTGEKREEMTTEKLDQLVADGQLTQEQADEYADWLSNRPDGPFVDKERMAKLLEEGSITQEQYDAWKAWHETKPDIELPKPDGQGKDGNKPDGQGKDGNKPDGQGNGDHRPQGNRPPPPASDNTTANQPPVGDNHRPPPPPPPGGPGGDRR